MTSCFGKRVKYRVTCRPFVELTKKYIQNNLRQKLSGEMHDVSTEPRSLSSLKVKVKFAYMYTNIKLRSKSM